jgi:hypothetical protein
LATFDWQETFCTQVALLAQSTSHVPTATHVMTWPALHAPTPLQLTSQLLVCPLQVTLLVQAVSPPQLIAQFACEAQRKAPTHD